MFKKKMVVSQTMSKQQRENSNAIFEPTNAPNCVKQLDTKSYWLNNKDVQENFVALFIADFKPYDTQQIGIWEPTNQPILIHEEIDGHYVSRYRLLKILSFKEVRNYAKKSCDVVSVSARNFFEIDKGNWRELVDKAISSFVDKAIGRKETEKRRAQKRQDSYLAGKDITYNVEKTRCAETTDLMRTFLKDKNYDIVFSENKMTIVKHSDDPWNHFNEFIAKSDGIYNYAEVQMGGYEEKKRVSCQDFGTACFLMLAFFIIRENLTDRLMSMSFARDCAVFVIEHSADYWNGQFIIDQVASFMK
ncbi:MAG: hypothetical protein J6Q89_06195 [Clostridia bacterium]|nr:hypothetical protein [Clostridia bacterium]